MCLCAGIQRKMRISIDFRSANAHPGSLSFCLHDDLDTHQFESTLLESGGRPLVRAKDVVTFSGVPWPIHGDILAAAAVLLFAPWIEQRVHFDFACSANCIASLSAFRFYRIREGKYIFIPAVQFTAQEICGPYSPGNKAVISYGGGFDSTAIALLFPNASLACSYDSAAEGDRLVEMMRKLGREQNVSCFAMPSTLREFTAEKCRFPCYAACMVPALLALDFFSAGYIMIGASMETSFLCDCKAYRATHLPQYENRWNALLRQLGIHVFSPLAGSNQILNAKICIDHGFEDSAYCFSGTSGACCHKCAKCFRKNLAMCMALDGTSRERYNEQYWARYSEKMIRLALDKPGAWCYTYAFVFSSEHSLPAGILSAHPFISQYMGKWLAPLADSWKRYFVNGILHIPEELRDDYGRRISSIADMMTEHENAWFLTYGAKNA